MNYGEFINIFDKNYNLNWFYANFLKEKKEIRKKVKDDVDNIFLNFLFKKIIKEDEEIKIFYKFYKNKFDLKEIYISYRNNLVSLEDFKKVESKEDLKYIVLNRYKEYLKKDIKEINDIDFKNLLSFIVNYLEFFKFIKNNKFFRDILLNYSKIEKNLNFLKILRIEEVEGNFICSYNENLKSLRGCPSWVSIRFDCSNNKKLRSLRYSPSWVGGDFYCSDCGLEELGMVDEVSIEGCFICDNNKKLKTLKYSPKWIGGSYICRNCNLEELGMQEGVRIKYDFDCSYNRYLKTLKGCPNWVGGDFVCEFCNLERIDLDANIEIGGDLYCLEGNNVTREQVEEYIRKNNIKIGGGIK